MTKSQILIACSLILFAILFYKQKFLDKTKFKLYNQKNYARVMFEVSKDISGKLFATQFGCVTCHGKDLKGTVLAPTLFGVSKFYSIEKLISYLKNPSVYMDTKRFQEFKKKYTSFMPSFKNKDVKDLEKIAEYLLKLK